MVSVTTCKTLSACALNLNWSPPATCVCINSCTSLANATFGMAHCSWSIRACSCLISFSTWREYCIPCRNLFLPLVSCSVHCQQSKTDAAAMKKWPLNCNGNRRWMISTRRMQKLHGSFCHVCCRSACVLPFLAQDAWQQNGQSNSDCNCVDSQRACQKRKKRTPYYQTGKVRPMARNIGFRMELLRWPWVMLTRSKDRT